MIRALIITLATALAAGPAGAAAAAAGGPTIEHEPITTARTGQPLRVRGRIRTAAGRTAFEPTVFLRFAGIAGYTRVAMQPVPDAEGRFEAEVPAALITGDFDYYLEAFDSEGEGPARVGAPETPLRVLIAAAPPPPAKPDKPLAPRLEPRPPLETLVVSGPALPKLRSRSQLPTFLLFAAAGLSLGAGISGTVGHQVLGGDLKSSFDSRDDGPMGASLHGTGETLGRIGIGGLVAAALFITSGSVYVAWPDAEPEPAEERR